jgi:methyl-accepting chemotaxis protein-1 (serine sensor receptor)
MNQECRPLLARLLSPHRGLRPADPGPPQELVAEAEARYVQHRLLLLLACLAAITTALAAGWLITRSLTRALGAEPGQLGAAAQRVAAGDLAQPLALEQAPAGSVLASLGAMQRSLVDIVQQVRSASDSIALGVGEIATGNGDLSQRTETQASALQQTAATMDEFQPRCATTPTTPSAPTSSPMRPPAWPRAAARWWRGGGHHERHPRQLAQDLRDHRRDRRDRLPDQHPGAQCRGRGRARRRAGRGFAVVAGEVRSLAQRSAEAAKEIKQLITHSAGQVGQGAELVGQAGHTMDEVVAAIHRVSAIVARSARPAPSRAPAWVRSARP